MDLEVIILNKISQRKTNTSDIISRWSRKYDTNELIYETDRLTDTENRLVVAKGTGVQERVGLGVCDYQMQTIYNGWINNKVLLYSRYSRELYSVSCDKP